MFADETAFQGTSHTHAIETTARFKKGQQASESHHNFDECSHNADSNSYLFTCMKQKSASPEN